MLWNIESGIDTHFEPGEQGMRGKAVVIVGNAAGLNQTTAKLLAEYGAPLFIAADSSQELSQTLDLVKQSGGEARGLVTKLCRPEEVLRFFDQAQRWLGQIDAVVSYLTMDDAQPGVEACQNAVMQEAIRRIGSQTDGQIIYVGPANRRLSREDSRVVRNQSAALRRQATEMGIRVTLIQPGAGSREDEEADTVLSAEDVARTVLESLAQPFGVDVIFLPGQLQIQP